MGGGMSTMLKNTSNVQHRDRAVGWTSHLDTWPGDGVLANMLRLVHNLDTAVLVVLEDVAVHLETFIGCWVHMQHK